MFIICNYKQNQTINVLIKYSVKIDFTNINWVSNLKVKSH